MPNKRKTPAAPDTARSTTRRGFFKAWAGSWGHAFSEAGTDSDYPLIFNGLRHMMHEGEDKSALLLTVGTPPKEFPESLSHAALHPEDTKALADTKRISEFCQKHGITHLLWDCAKAPHGILPPCPAMVMNAPEGFKAIAPTLFMFTNDQALTHGDMLGQVVRNQTEECDIYIGRLKEDLADADSPTWKRIKLFLDDY